ncbi:hypothetical protein HAX54_032574, partial [Datura stramonium]|nr:hypothetical protein [Datura stramonium]
MKGRRERRGFSNCSPVAAAGSGALVRSQLLEVMESAEEGSGGPRGGRTAMERRRGGRTTTVTRSRFGEISVDGVLRCFSVSLVGYQWRFCLAVISPGTGGRWFPVVMVVSARHSEREEEGGTTTVVLNWRGT